MRVVYMGTPSFAIPALESLLAIHEVVAVYTRPDRPSGRGRALRPSPVKLAATAAGIRVLQPATLRDPAAIEEFRSLDADVCVVAAYGAILPLEVLEAPRFGCVNLHASLLPKWRGAAPVQRAILAGDETAGVSIMRMEEGLDTGPYAEQVRVDIDGLTADSLTDTMARQAPPALLRVLEAMAAASVTWTAQDDSLATYAAKLTAADVALSPDLDMATAMRRVRASGRSTPARCEIAGVCATITGLAESGCEPGAGSGAEPSAGPGTSPVVVSPGDVLATRRHLLLGFADGALAVERLTPMGRPDMDGASFGRGFHTNEGLTWGACT